jgi:hypothetical protein
MISGSILKGAIPIRYVATGEHKGRGDVNHSEAFQLLFLKQ